VIAIVALLVTGPGGSYTDRYGARIVLIVGMGCMMAGNTLLAFATEPLVAGVALALVGVNFGVSWPAFNALIASVVKGELRQRYFGVNFALVNLGIGVGGVIGGFYVDVSRPETFTAIFLADAAFMLVPLALLLGPLRHVHGRAEQPVDDDGAHPVTYWGILRQPSVLWLTALTFLAVFIGYGQMEAGFPAFAREVSEVSTRTIGLAFAVNTAVIVLLQFWVLNQIAGRRRTRVMVVMGVVWAASWVLLGSTGILDGAAAMVGVLVFMAVFAFGETLLQPTVPAITNDLAPDHLRGRYNAVGAGAFQAGTIAGPVAAGWLLEHDLEGLYVGIMIVGCGLIAVLAIALERRISPEVNGVTVEEVAPAP
jgi:MFS family permease